MKKAFKIIGYTIGGILLIIIIAIVFLLTPWGKLFLTKQVTAFLNEKLNTEVLINKIDFTIPNSIGIQKLSIQDLNNDTLLSINMLRLDINMLALINSKIDVKGLYLDGVNAYMHRKQPDTFYNYQFIIDAFAGKNQDTLASTNVSDTASKPLGIEVVKTHLTNIKFRFNDEMGGTDFDIHLKELFLKPKLIDINKLQFDVNELSISGVRSTLLMKSSLLPPTIDTSTGSSPLSLSAEKLILKDVTYTMENKVSPMYLKTYVGSLEGKVSLFDLIQQLIQIDKLALEESDVQIILGKVDNTKEPSIQEEDVAAVIDTLGWRIVGEQVNLRNVDFKFDDNNAPKQKVGMDYAHLDVQNIVFLSENVRYTNDTISGNIKQLALKEQSGLVLQEMRTIFAYHNKGAQLEKFYLKTPQTILQNKLKISYPSLASISKNLNTLAMDVNLDKSVIGIDDILLFMPVEQRNTFLPYVHQKLNVTALLTGYLNDLQIKNLVLSGLNNTKIHVNGLLKGLPDPEKLSYNFNITELSSNRKDIDPFLPKSIHEQINIPQQFSISGKVIGNLYAYQPDVFIKTSDGNAGIKGVINIKPEGAEKYDLVVNAIGLNLGKILRQDSLMGMVTTDIAVKGTSFDLQKMQAEFDLNLKQANLMAYNYQNIKATGFIKNNFAMVKAVSEDPNARFTLDGTADLTQKHPSVLASIQLEHLDLLALQLSADTLSVAGIIEVDAPVLDPDYPIATLFASEMEVAVPGVKLPLDSIIIKANSDPINGQNIEGSIAKILNFGLTGKIPLTQVGNAAIAHINRHYHIADSFVAAENYDMALTANFVYNPILKRFDPNIKPFDTVKLSANLNPSTFDLSLNFPRIVYGQNILNQGKFIINEDINALNYALNLDYYKMGNTIALYSPSVSGNINNNNILTNISIADSLRKEQFEIGALINQQKNTTGNSDIIVKLSEGLMFNYDNWNVNRQNEIRIGDAGINISNFAISQDNQSIALQSESNIPNSPIDLTINNFKLSNITSIISGDTLIADGVLNADGNLELDPNGPFMYLNAKVDEMKIFEVPFGILDIKAQNRSSKEYDASVLLTGNGNNVNLSGRYNLAPSDGNELDFKLQLEPLSLASIDGLTFGNLKNSSGNLKGSLDIKGSISKPQILGTLETENLTTKVSMLGVQFSIPKEKLAFTDKGIIFDKFKIYDEENSYLSIGGSVRSRDFTQYFLNLDIKANHWKPINSTEKDYEMLYGELYLTTDLNVRGVATAPRVTGNLLVHDDTKLSFALLDSDPQIVETEGVVKFIDRRYPVDETEDSLNSALNRIRFSRSAQMNINVALEKKATFNLVIDPSTGDNLQVKGEAALNTQIAPNGSIGLVGTYLIDDGYYELSFPPVRRRFKIDQGSTITLAGDPLDAEVNITAKYTNNVAPYDLMESSITDPAQLVYYKQRIPIDVILKLNGSALKPDISFDIQVPEDKINVVSGEVGTNVKNRLAVLRTNASDINKQVFGVIVLGKFISEDPFNVNGGAEVEHIARQSVSRFLSTQLNTIAGQFITGLDLNMDLESSEDYTSGQKQNRTDLNISASKSLFQDRLSVTVGNDFLLEGAPTQNKQTSYIPGSLSADYKLSKDGRYQIRAYRKNELQNIIDGYVVETGVGFRMNLEYNRFRSIFMSSEQLRAYYRRQREKEEKAKEAKEKKEVSLLFNNDLLLNRPWNWYQPYYYFNY